eukprot:TRINITY_DN368_c0_g1_i1.p1 TRINITY_DN368_c0_g1~~TRINITY_DN368_c0_g1_i1.p1  ORF type:complete len:476 (+),score=142.59 TRINITY_DN368_c0_g1_i1:168-1595(+)
MSKVTWYWLADDGSWKTYDDTMRIRLEAAFKKGAKKLDVDKERFVDFSLSHDEILTNFTNLKGKDKGVCGIQRRKDDPNKRRAVKREESKDLDFLHDTVFVLLNQVMGKKLKKKEEELVATIKAHGGEVHTTLTRKVDHLLVNPADIKFPPPKEADEAENLGIAITSEEFIAKCVMSGSLEDHDKFEVKLPTKPNPADLLEGGMPTMADTSTGKRKGDDDDSDKTLKKGKSDVGSTSTSTTSTSSSSSGSGSAALVSGSEWMGVCIYKEDDNHYPFKLIVSEVKGENVNGFVEWPTLNNAKTKFKGTLKGASFNFQEYEAVQGADDVQIPMDYTGKIDGITITGDVGDKDSKATFKLKSLTKVSSTPPTSTTTTTTTTTTVPDFEFSVGKKWKGVCLQDMPFVLKITDRTNDTFTGTIAVDGDDAEKITGKINGTEITIEGLSLFSEAIKGVHDRSTKIVEGKTPDGFFQFSSTL